jgi:hypothetical protein
MFRHPRSWARRRQTRHDGDGGDPVQGGNPMRGGANAGLPAIHREEARCRRGDEPKIAMFFWVRRQREKPTLATSKETDGVERWRVG